jgi:hypothetical protein
VARVDVVVEEGKKKTFASALEWPGWARAGKSRDDALDVLDAYRDRYAEVLAASSIDTPSGTLFVREVVHGNATTDFGAPGKVAERDHRVLRPADRERFAAILVSCWSRFDDVASTAGALRTGPRGGGRQVDKMRRHVTDAEVAYARGLGLRASATNGEPDAIEALRSRILGVLANDVAPDREGPWPPRYAVRRIAWHVLDHLFEIEDRSLPG